MYSRERRYSSLRYDLDKVPGRVAEKEDFDPDIDLLWTADRLGVVRKVRTKAVDVLDFEPQMRGAGLVDRVRVTSSPAGSYSISSSRLPSVSRWAK